MIYRSATSARNTPLVSLWRYVALLLCTLVWALPGQAQTKPFPTDQALFLQEMTTFLVEADKKEGRPFM